MLVNYIYEMELTSYNLNCRFLLLHLYPEKLMQRVEKDFSSKWSPELFLMMLTGGPTKLGKLHVMLRLLEGIWIVVEITYMDDRDCSYGFQEPF
jgi:hypothetical protein